MDTDFGSIIYKRETPTEARIRLEDEKHQIEIQEQNHDFRSALTVGDYQKAGSVLQKAGSCNWRDIVSGEAIVVPRLDSVEYKRFAAHFSMNKGSTRLELLEEMPTTIFSHNYVPRLTISAESCP